MKDLPRLRIKFEKISRILYHFLGFLLLFLKGDTLSTVGGGGGVFSTIGDILSTVEDVQ